MPGEGRGIQGRAGAGGGGRFGEVEAAAGGVCCMPGWRLLANRSSPTRAPPPPLLPRACRWRLATCSGWRSASATSTAWRRSSEWGSLWQLAGALAGALVHWLVHWCLEQHPWAGQGSHQPALFLRQTAPMLLCRRPLSMCVVLLCLCHLAPVGGLSAPWCRWTMCWVWVALTWRRWTMM